LKGKGKKFLENGFSVIGKALLRKANFYINKHKIFLYVIDKLYLYKLKIE